MPKFLIEKRKAEMQAGAFALSLVVLVILSVGVALTSFDTVVLGTELNANGTVEYLCLGAGCEDFRSMDW